MTRIGSRWTAGPIKRRDTASGFYEEINPLLLSSDAQILQIALLVEDKVVHERFTILRSWLIVIVLGAAVLAVTWP